MPDRVRFPAGADDPRYETGLYLTEGAAPLGGSLKERPEDFVVEEQPLYHPSGDGEHLYLMLEKRGMTTMDLVGVVARHFRVRRSAVGVAGLKDKQAITRQVVSVHTPGKRPDDFPSLIHDQISVLWIDLHENKLRRGHLAGNRFSIKIRGVDPLRALDAKRSLDRLAEVGVPNRIGEQRFGYLGNNHLIGAALFLGRADEAVRLLLEPHGAAPEHQLAFRDAYGAGDLAAAFDRCPRQFRTERQLLSALADGLDPLEAWLTVDPTVRSYYYSAAQSAVFNRVLDRRLAAGTIGELLVGDLAFREASRRVFSITPERLRETAVAADLDAKRIGPSGPMWGDSMIRASGSIDDAEVRCLGELGLTPADLDHAVDQDLDSIEGARRPLRVALGSPDVEGGVDEHGPYVRCAFDLPRGSFATTVMREVMKPNPVSEAASAGSVPGHP